MEKDKEKINKDEAIELDQDNDDINCYNFELRLYIKHKSESLAFIQEKIPLAMTNGWSIGTERRAPNGKLLGGIRNETYWSYHINVKGRRDFFNYAVSFLISLVEKYQLDDFFREFTSENGEINLVINLIDHNNIGDLLTLDHMKILSKYNVNLGLEYFV
ncbi:hypothetical protein [Acinetobacter gyllenbergii]|uniref:hypothetical protein n=1 Tax=Acinetobacter gyllenbergii TaxID=134534 RepID=UPI003F555DC6